MTRVSNVRDMSTREEIQNAVCRLSTEELSRFRACFLAFDGDAWDRQIEQDVAAGRLERFAQEALEDLRAGRTRTL